MIELLQKLLKELAPAAWRIEELNEESAELFFVKKELDTRRSKNITRWTATVFRDDEEGNRGFSAVSFFPGQPENEIREKLKEAYAAAFVAMNPGYVQPDPVQGSPAPKANRLTGLSLPECAGRMAAALFAADRREDVFLNSAEIFAQRCATRILSSEGTDVFWQRAEVKGEFVAQCPAPEDVELYQDFSYDDLETEALTVLAEETLRFAADRARAQKILKSGRYDLVLTGSKVGDILSFYTDRSYVGMVYPGYSDWKIGETVQEAEEGYEALQMELIAVDPFSSEGIAMRNRPLLRDGVLQTVHGGNRLSRYLGLEPSGEYRKICCGNPGSASLAELKKAPCLWAVTFSDFQMDPMSGYFGGEIRLAYLIEEDRITPVTGGSVSGLILDAAKQLRFSRERYTSASYDGPKGVRIRNVSVAGV